MRESERVTRERESERERGREREREGAETWDLRAPGPIS